MILAFVSLYTISLLYPYLQEQAFYFTRPMQPIILWFIDSSSVGCTLIVYKAILQGTIMEPQKPFIIKR